MDTNEKHRLYFEQLVFLFQSAALQHMGKLKNPATDKIERNLPQTQFMIDMLDMIEVRMKGNLSPEEERLITTVVKELKLNYVDEMNKPDPSPEPSQAAT